jgi:hypothetical protein
LTVGKSELLLPRSSGLTRKIIDVSLLVCLSLGTLYAGARVGLMPRDPSQGVAVIFAPWTVAEKTLARSVEGGGRFVRFGGLPFIAVVMPDNANYPDRMLDAGAWLVVDPQTLAACSAALSFTRQPT